MAGFIIRRKDPLLFVTVLLILLCILASQAENESGSSLLTRTVMGAFSPFVRLSAGFCLKTLHDIFRAFWGRS